MQLMDRRIEHIKIEVTPEMRARIQELNQFDMERYGDIAKHCAQMQYASRQAAAHIQGEK